MHQVNHIFCIKNKHCEMEFYDLEKLSKDVEEFDCLDMQQKLKFCFKYILRRTVALMCLVHEIKLPVALFIS